MTWAGLTIIFFLLACPPAVDPGKGATQHNKSVNIIYTGNMGLLIGNEKTAVWIDGPHEYYGPEYLNPPDSILQKASSRTAPFKNLQWLLFTHYHRDHFSKKLVNRLLEQGSHCKVIGAPQVVDSFSVKDVINAWDKNAEILHDNSSSLRIKAFNIPHTWPQRHAKVQNIAYLLELNGVRILHLGDADTDIGVFNPSQLGDIDIVIVPSWFIGNEKGTQIIEKLEAKRVVVTHLAPRDKHGNTTAIKDAEVVYFDKIGQLISL